MRRALVVLARASLASVVMLGCDKPAPPKDKDAAPADSASAATPKTASINGRLGCQPTTPGGSILEGKLEPGQTTIAAAKGRALVVNTVFKEPPKVDVGDALESASTERVVLGSTGAPEGPMEAVKEPHTNAEGPCCALTFGAATAFGDDLTTLAFGTSRFAAAGCGGGVVTVKTGSAAPKPISTGVEYCKFASVMAGGARGDFAVAATDGPLTKDIADGWPTVLDALAYAGGKAKNVRLESIANPSGAPRSKIDVPAVAVGDTWAAVAWRVTKGASKELHLARVNKDGTRSAKVEVLDTTIVGAPALAFDGDTLHVVWASRVADKDPYVLRWSKWSGTAPPSAPQALKTRTSAFAPSIAVANGRFFLAWMEGDEKNGHVHAGASKMNILGAVSEASEISRSNVNARDPEVAMDKNDLFVVWQEFSGKPELRATTLKCID